MQIVDEPVIVVGAVGLRLTVKHLAALDPHILLALTQTTFPLEQVPVPEITVPKLT